MFRCLTGSAGGAVCADATNTAWYTLKTAVESILPQVDSQVRFGFTTVFGTNPSGGGMCPSLQGMLTNNISPALNNAGTITALYDGLAFPPNSTQVGQKFEAPISESLGALTQVLGADTDPGSKTILLVTDGQPDYCDDSNSLCAPDSVVLKLQTAFTAGIPTIVFGIQTSLFDLAPGVLQAFANAGAGEPTLAPIKTGGSTFDFYDQCSGVNGWAVDLSAAGKPSVRGTTLGTYSTTMGPTVPYPPTAAGENQLAAQLKAATLTCSYDLAPAVQGDVDFNKVNVQFTGGTGSSATIGHTGSSSACDKGGWYYDVDPSAGTPTKIIACPTTCGQFNADVTGHVKIVLGCATISVT